MDEYTQGESILLNESMDLQILKKAERQIFNAALVLREFYFNQDCKNTGRKVRWADIYEDNRKEIAEIIKRDHKLKFI